MSGLTRLISEFRANTLSKVQLVGSDNDINDLPQAYSMVLFHICQEALANIAKHSKAKQVEISLWATDERVLMEIHDNGKGFDVDRSPAGHYGLVGMRARARLAGGTLAIDSAPDGTCIRFVIGRSL